MPYLFKTTTNKPIPIVLCNNLAFLWALWHKLKWGRNSWICQEKRAVRFFGGGRELWWWWRRGSCATVARLLYKTRGVSWLGPDLPPENRQLAEPTKGEAEILDTDFATKGTQPPPRSEQSFASAVLLPGIRTAQMPGPIPLFKSRGGGAHPLFGTT